MFDDLLVKQINPKVITEQIDTMKYDDDDNDDDNDDDTYTCFASRTKHL